MDPITEVKNQAAPIVEEFELPDEIANKDSYIKKSIGLVKLKMSQEMRCAELAGQAGAKMGFLMARMALVEVDGRVVDRSIGEEETIMEHTDPMIRELVIAAYAEIATVEVVSAKKFLKSRKTKVR